MNRSSLSASAVPVPLTSLLTAMPTALTISLGALPSVATHVGAQIHARPNAETAAMPSGALYERAWFDWNAGRYDASLSTLADILKRQGTDPLLPYIAELTGESYRTAEIAKDTRTAAWRVRWAADNRHFAYDTGSGEAQRTIVAMWGDNIRRVARFVGTNAVFAPDSRSVAYLAPRGAQQPPGVRIRDLASGQERELDDAGMIVSELAWASDGAALFGIAATVDQAPAQVFAWRGGGGAPVQVTQSDSSKADLTVVAGGRYLVYAIRGGAGGGGRGGRGGGGGGRGGPAAGGSFEVLDLTTNATRRYAGRSFVVAQNGSALAYLSGGAASSQSFVQRILLTPLGDPQIVFRSDDALAAPAISPDGSRVAFQQMMREDWEIMVADVRDASLVRLTHDIQHDLTPTFLTNDRLLGLIGEARHRRSYLYDIATVKRTRLFHNNSVRTIAPEYEWAPSPDGTKILIVAERDGDTVTPHRNLYCTDLSAPVTRAVLVTRVDSALSAERALRAYAGRVFTPIDGAVKAATSEVDVGRVYDYAQTLYGFDTKFWTQPGNRKAREYLLSTYRSFGYSNARFMAFTPSGRGGGRGGAATPAEGAVETANVIAVLPGTENPELVYVVGSHFDSVIGGPGADDNTSGTTALLEAARVLAKRPQPATIVFVSFTGEEGGLLGSREFVRQVRDSIRIVGALNNDMIGFANDERLDNTIRYSNAGIKEIQHAAALRYSNLITYDAFYYKSTDAAAFYDAYGDIVGGIGSYPVLGSPHYHQSHDVLETINQQLVAEVSKTTVATLMMLASSPSRLTGLTVARSGEALDIKWTPSPEKGVDRYLVAYTPPNGPPKQITVRQSNARLTDAPAGTAIAVKAVNRRGLEGWDWARIIAP
jgi:hypothetical protein